MGDGGSVVSDDGRLVGQCSFRVEVFLHCSSCFLVVDVRQHAQEVDAFLGRGVVDVWSEVGSLCW